MGPLKTDTPELTLGPSGAPTPLALSPLPASGAASAALSAALSACWISRAERNQNSTARWGALVFRLGTPSESFWRVFRVSFFRLPFLVAFERETKRKTTTLGDLGGPPKKDEPPSCSPGVQQHKRNSVLSSAPLAHPNGPLPFGQGP